MGSQPFLWSYMSAAILVRGFGDSDDLDQVQTVWAQVKEPARGPLCLGLMSPSLSRIGRVTLDNSPKLLALSK